MGSLLRGWNEFQLKDVVDYDQPNAYIIEKPILKDENLTPVLTANKSFIKGYTGETKGIYNNVPVIIFDDFTADNKFVSFPFKVKSSAMKILKLKSKDVLLKFVFYQMQLKEINTTTHKRYYISIYQNLNFIFPINKDNKIDLDKQQLIVEEIEKQTTRLDASIQTLKDTKRKLEVYRRSVLKAAFEGRFSNNFNIKSMSDILKQVSTDRKHHWENEQLLKFSKKKKSPPKNWKAKYKEPKAIEISQLNELPKHWIWTNFDNICDFGRNAIKAGPFGSSLKKEYYSEKGYKIYGQEQVIRNDPYYGDYYINQERFNLLRSCAVKPGDILVSLVGTIGKILILPEDCEKGIINPRLVKFSLNRKIANPNYIKFYLISPFAVSWLLKDSHGQTMNILNLTILRDLPIPLVDYEEQEAIVEEIESRFSVIDKLDEAVDNALIKAELLRKSILKYAFEDKLIKYEGDKNG